MLPKCHYSYNIGGPRWCSDLRIQCGEGSLSAHRGVLSVHSPLLRGILEDLENKEEGADYVLVLPDVCLADLENLLKVLYGSVDETRVSGDLLKCLGIILPSNYSNSDTAPVSSTCSALPVPTSPTPPPTEQLSATGTVQKNSTAEEKRQKHITFPQEKCSLCDKIFASKSGLQNHIAKRVCLNRSERRSSTRSSTPGSWGSGSRPGTPDSLASNQSTSVRKKASSTKYKCSKCSESFETMLEASTHIKNCGNEMYQCGECQLVLHDYELMQEHVQGHMDNEEEEECMAGNGGNVITDQDHEEQSVEVANVQPSEQVPESNVDLNELLVQVGTENEVEAGDVEEQLYSEVRELPAEHHEDGLALEEESYEDVPLIHENQDPVHAVDCVDQTQADVLNADFLIEDDSPVQVEESKDAQEEFDEVMEGEVLTEEVIEEAAGSMVIVDDYKEKGQVEDVDIDTTEVVIEAEEPQDIDEERIVLVEQEQNEEHFCSVCKNGFCKVEQLSAHITSHPLCSVCNTRFLNLDALHAHSQTHPSCNRCNKVFVDDGGLQNHMKIHHNPVEDNIMVSTYQVKEVRDAVESITETVKEVEIPVENTAVVRETSTNPLHRCKLCYREFSTDEVLNIHLLGVHGNIKATIENPDFEISVLESGIPCQFCDLQLDSPEALNQHTLLNHDVYFKEISSPKVGENVDVFQAVDANQAAELPPGGLPADQVAVQEHTFSFLCGVCHTSFDSIKVLGKHVASAHKVGPENFKPTRCAYCETTFVSPLTLKKHYINKHKGVVQRYVCAECGKECKTDKDLISHLPNHSDVRPYQCGRCQRSFKIKQSLHAHSKRCSDGNEPQAPTPTELLVTLSPETNELEWSCPLCDAKFARQELHIGHKCRKKTTKRKSSAQKTVHQCNDCVSIFQSAKLLKIHQRTHKASKDLQDEDQQPPADDGHLHDEGRGRSLFCGEPFSDDDYIPDQDSLSDDEDFEVPRSKKERNRRSVNNTKDDIDTDYYPTVDLDSGGEQDASDDSGEDFVSDDDFEIPKRKAVKRKRRKPKPVEEERKLCVNNENRAEDDLKDDLKDDEPQYKLVNSGKLFKCNICGKGYSRKGYFQDHYILSHSRDFPFTCQFCGKGWLRPNKLTLHVCRSEEFEQDGDESYSCEFCGEVANTKNEYSFHFAYNRVCGRKKKMKKKKSKPLETVERKKIDSADAAHSEEEKETMEEEETKEEEDRTEVEEKLSVTSLTADPSSPAYNPKLVLRKLKDSEIVSSLTVVHEDDGHRVEEPAAEGDSEEIPVSRSGRKIIRKKYSDFVPAEEISAKRIRLDFSPKKASTSPAKTPPVDSASGGFTQFCQICKEQYQTNLSYFRHLLVHVPDSIVSNLPAGDQVWCPHCPGPVLSSQVDMHMEEHHQNVKEDVSDELEAEGVKVNPIEKPLEDSDADDSELTEILNEKIEPLKSINPVNISNVTKCSVLLPRLTKRQLVEYSIDM